MEQNREPSNRHTNIVKFDNGAKTFQWRMDNQFGARMTGCPYAKSIDK